MTRTRRLGSVLLVMLLSSALVVGMPGQAQALEGVTIGPADRWAIKAVGGVVQAPAPTVLSRGAKTCLKPTPGAAACALGVLALLALGASVDTWWPWLANKIGEELNQSDASGVGVPCSHIAWNPQAPTGAPTIDTFPNLDVIWDSVGKQEIGGNGVQCWAKFEVTSTIMKSNGELVTRTNNPTSTYFAGQSTAMNQELGSQFWPVGYATNDRVMEIRIHSISNTSTPATAGEGSINDLYFKAAASESSINVQTVVRCQRPDATEYDVTKGGTPNLGYVKVGYCEAGDTAIGWKLVHNGIPHMDVDTRPANEDAVRYPACAGAACGYTVRLDGVQCVEGDGRCEDWARVAQETPTRVGCYYGPYKLTTDACWWLERAFNTKSYPLTAPNVDGDPDTVQHPSADPTPSPSTSTSASPTPSTGPTAGPAPTITAAPPAGPPPASCSTPYALGAVQSQTAALVNAVAPRFGIATVYGWREKDAFPDHPSGLAADFMTYTNTAKGDSLATYVIQNAPTLMVDYVIWKQRIWSVDRAAEGWRVMADRGSPTANHMDHVHVTTRNVAGSVSCSGDPGDSDPESDDCWPTGWAAVMNPASWVLQPTQCAIKWAFVPKKGHEAFIDWWDVAKADFNASPLGSWGAAFAGWGVAFAALGTDVGCRGPGVSTGFLGERDVIADTIYPFDACGGVMAQVAATSNIILTVSIVFFTSWRLVRIVGRPFGYDLNFVRESGKV